MLSQVKFLMAAIKANTFLIVAIFFLAIWVSLSAFINTSQFGDNFEQFNWAHSWEWGYWKHPPLTTWLLFGFQSLFGFNYLNTYFLAFVCLSTTLFFYNKIGKILIGHHFAEIATLLLSSSFMFTWRAQMFNHNTVLVMMLTILCWYYFYNIYKKNSNELKIINWLLFGAFLALCFLAKYQSIIFFVGLGITSYLAAKNSNNKISIFGIFLTILIAMMMIYPHLFWIFKNKFMIMHYTADRFNIDDYSFLDQFKNLISFLVQQIRFFIIPLLILSILSFDTGRKKFTKLFKLTSISGNSWVWGLILFPFLFLIFLNLFCGLKLANHWGMSVFLFTPIFACFFCIAKKFKRNFFLLIYTGLQILSLSIFIFYKNGASLSQHKRNDEAYPSKIISNLVIASWKDRSDCKINFISGPAFESGVVSVYSGEYPQVLEDGDFTKSPWINKNDIERDGMIVISRSSENLSKYTKIFSLPVEVTSTSLSLLDFYWAIIPPLKEC